MGKNGNESRQIRAIVSAYMKKFHMTDPGEKILVGLSGGADSVCLFLLLLSLREEMGFELEAVHVNHCMRDSAKRDEDFVRTLCKDTKILLHVFSVDVPLLVKEQGLSPEEAARNARYDCFVRAMGTTGASKVAVAHHRADQAETMLFHLIRGSGIDGMSGMKAVRGQVIRPILCLNKIQIESYLAEQGQAFVTDETNTSTDYSRNKLRHEAFPVLEDVCRGAVQHMSATAEMFSELSDYLDDRIREALDECADVSEQDKGCIRLSCDKLTGLHEYLQGEVILECIYLVSGSKKDISRVHVEAVKGLVKLQVGRKIDLPYGITVEKSYGMLVFRDEENRDVQTDKFCVRVSKAELENGISVRIPDGRQIQLRTFAYNQSDEIPTKTYTKWLDCDKIGEMIEIRTPAPEDYFYLNHKNKKYVKDYMVNEKIPMDERAKSVLVADGNHMLYFVGKRISNGVLVEETTGKILEITVTGG